MAATVTIRHLSKTFAGIPALDDVDLTLEPGEVHGLLGQNGSGKSTLIKVLAGFHAPDPGAEILAHGERLALPLGAKELEALGWVFVHQDLGLLQELRVLDNFHLMRLGSAQRPVIQWRRDREYVASLLRGFNVEVSPDAIVGELSGAQRAMVAVVRAAELIRIGAERAGSDPDRGGLLVLDEPTAYLPEGDAAQLFDLVRRVASAGTAVLLVSHMLDEIRAVTDRVTVLRDGRVTASAETASVSNAELVESIVGHEVSVTPKTVLENDGAGDHRYSVSVQGLASPRTATIDLEVRSGQVLGITGLAGSGADDVPYLLFGAQPAQGGTLTIDGEQVDLRRLRPDVAMRLGIAFIPSNRLAQGAAGDLAITMNMTLTTLERYTRGGVLGRQQERSAAWGLVNDYDVRPRDPDRLFAQLSGGNQQKALLAKWLQDAPRLLILHEPAQGLDVKARAQVVEIVRALAHSGTAVICASTDFEQIEQICDRVVILRRGHIRSELTGGEITQRRLSEESLSQEDAA